MFSITFINKAQWYKGLINNAGKIRFCPIFFCLLWNAIHKIFKSNFAYMEVLLNITVHNCAYREVLLNKTVHNCAYMEVLLNITVYNSAYMEVLLEVRTENCY